MLLGAMSRINFGKLIAEDSEKWKGDPDGQHQGRMNPSQCSN